MTTITIELSPQEVKALKARTGKRTTNAALRAWVGKADSGLSVSQMRTALARSIREETKGKGRRFGSGREAMRWLES